MVRADAGVRKRLFEDLFLIAKVSPAAPRGLMDQLIPEVNTTSPAMGRGICWRGGVRVCSHNAGCGRKGRDRSPREGGEGPEGGEGARAARPSHGQVGEGL